MNRNEIVKQMADILWNASFSHDLCEPLRSTIGTADLALAYEIQAYNTQRRLAEGALITGKKIGLTSFAVQKQLGVDQPDFGILLSDKEVWNGGAVSMTEMHQPKAEGEIAFVLKSDLTKTKHSIIDIINAIDYVLPSIEIVGSRIRDWDIRITDTIADNASASHYVLGHRPTLLKDIDLASCKMVLHKNGVEVSTGIGSASLGSPLNACLWLADKMVEMQRPLRAGEVLLSGALGPVSNVVAGDEVECTIEGLGTVKVSFTV